MALLFWTSPPPPTPSRLSQSMAWSSLSHRASSHQLSVLRMVVHTFPILLSIRPAVSIHSCYHKSVLCVCISTGALQMGPLDLGTEPTSPTSPCIGRRVLYCWGTWEAQQDCSGWGKNGFTLIHRRCSAGYKLPCEGVICREASLPSWGQSWRDPEADCWLYFPQLGIKSFL